MVSFHADRTGGLWAIGEHEIVHLRNGAVTSHFPLEGQQRTANISEDSDGSLWILQAGYDIATPLCHVTDRAVKCFGEADGLRIPTGGEALRPDGNGGYWLGGQRTLVHWRQGASEVYPIAALKSNSADGVAALALDGNASLWVGLLPEGSGEGLGCLKDGVLKPFVTQGFDGSKLAVFAMTVDREGSLWVGTVDNGLFRIRGTAVEHYGRAEGLSSDSVQALFEDRDGILWVATATGIDSFRDPPVTAFSVLWRHTRRLEFWPEKTAQFGLRTTARLTASTTGLCRRFAGEKGCRARKLQPCPKIGPGTYGWLFLTDCTFSKMAGSGVWPSDFSSNKEVALHGGALKMELETAAAPR